MPLNPEDVVRKSFRTSRLRRGYDEEEVDAFLEEVVVELRRMQAEIDQLKAGAAAPAHTGSRDRVALEEEQLERIRQERAELVADLERLQDRHDRMSTRTRAVSEDGKGHDTTRDGGPIAPDELEPVGRHRGLADKGATAVEYALVVGSVASVIVGFLVLLGFEVVELLQGSIEGLW